MDFLLASEALWVAVKERGVWVSKKLRRICRAWALEQLRVDEITVTSRLSANQLEREAASPAARYLVMEVKTENSPSADWGTMVRTGVTGVWAAAERLQQTAASATRICRGFLIPAYFLQIPRRIVTFVNVNIVLLTVGKTDVNWVKEGLEVYTSRLRHYVPFQVKEIPELKKASALSREQIKEKEGELIFKQLEPSDTLVLLDEHGAEYRSLEFAGFLEKQMNAGVKTLVFAVGGAYGFSDQVHARARAKMALSKMTFNHQMVRTIFAEQLYRAFTILKGEPYHNE